MLSAGYFRARIATLSPFDKVVGGLCWCITSSGEDIDVDILFTENSTIGEKIKLSEHIVTACRKMRCPHPLQAHQIQGSDFPALFPVIVWLVLKFFENRDATQGILRKYSELQWNKNYKFPNEEVVDESPFLETVRNRYKAQRKFRRAKGSRINTEEARIQSCLLEFGDKIAERAGEFGDEISSKGSLLASSLHVSECFIQGLNSHFHAKYVSSFVKMPKRTRRNVGKLVLRMQQTLGVWKALQQQQRRQVSKVSTRGIRKRKTSPKWKGGELA